MLNIFTDNWNELPTLNDGEHLVRIITDNASDSLYTIIDEDMDADQEICRALHHKFGNTCEFGGYEDMDCLYEQVEGANSTANDVWDGEGYYIIGWSDGGMDWTSDGPVWFDTEDDLAAEILCAYGDATETHIPTAEKTEDAGDEV